MISLILYTRIENYRSIGKQQVLSAIPGSDKTHIDKLINIGVEKIIPVIPIYGGNATGKTNSLRFLKTLQDQFTLAKLIISTKIITFFP